MYIYTVEYYLVVKTKNGIRKFMGKLMKQQQQKIIPSDIIQAQKKMWYAVTHMQIFAII